VHGKHSKRTASAGQADLPCTLLHEARRNGNEHKHVFPALFCMSFSGMAELP